MAPDRPADEALRPSPRAAVDCDGVHGELIHDGDRWKVHNEAEAETLAALGASPNALGWLQALARTLDMGLIRVGDLQMLSNQLGWMCEHRDRFAWFAAADGLGPATAFASAHSGDSRLESRLASLLLHRLDFNMVDGAAWADWDGNVYCHVGHATHWTPRGDPNQGCEVQILEELPQQFWTALREHPAHWLRETEAATDPRTPAKTLRRLVSNGHPLVRRALAAHPNSANAVLWMLACRRDASDEIRRAVGRNRGASRRLLRCLSQQGWRAQCAVARHPRTTEEMLTALISQSGVLQDPDVAVAIALNPVTPLETLRFLVWHGEFEVVRSAAQNPAASFEILQELLAHRHRAVRAAAVRNPGLPVDIAVECRDDRAMGVRRAVAQRADVPADVLGMLARDPKTAVRAAVASHPAASEHDLRTLGSDPDEDVRKWVADNEQTPPDVLARLAADPSFMVRNYVATNRGAPAEVLAVLADDRIAIQETLATNPAADASTLDRLASHRDWRVRAATAANPLTPLTVLERLADDETMLVRHPAARSLTRAQQTSAGSDTTRRQRSARRWLSLRGT